MSLKQMLKVWEHEFDANDQQTMFALADHADDDGRNIYPSLARVAWKLGVHRDTARRRVQKLRSSGVLVMVTPANPHAHKPAEYRFDWTAARPKAPFRSDTAPLPPGGTNAPRGVDAPRGTHAPQGGGTAVQPEPSENLSVEEEVEGAGPLMGFDEQEPLKRLQQTDREAHKLLEVQGGQLGWKFRHKNLAAARILANRAAALEALQLAHKKARGEGASAYGLFESILDDPQPEHRRRAPAATSPRPRAATDVEDRAARLKGDRKW